MSTPLHVTSGDAAVAAIAAAAGVAPDAVLVWRDVLHDGPVPAGLGPDELAAVRADHLAARGWADRDAALADLRSRDARLRAHSADADVVLWFEDDLFDALQLAQVEDRLAGRPGRVLLVRLPHPPRGDLRAALAAARPLAPDPAAFAALRASDPRAWAAVRAFARLLEELPDVTTRLGRLEREVLEALAGGPLAAPDLFRAVAAREDPPWVGDWSVWAAAADLGPLVRADGRRPAVTYAITDAGRDVLSGRVRRPAVERWIGGVHLVPGRPGFAWDPAARSAVPVRVL